MRFIIPALCAFVLLNSCEMNVRNSIRGNGNMTSQTRSVGSFTKVDVSGPFDVYVTQGAAAAVKVDADENLQQYIEVIVKGDEVNIQTRDHYNLRPRSDIKIYITSPAYQALSITGSGNLRSDSKLSTDRIDISVTGSGEMTVNVDAPIVKSEVTGSGTIRLNGATRRFDAEINGSGEVHAFDLLSEEAGIEINGSGDAEVFASKTLKIEVSGSGDVQYKGTASVNQSVAGSGNVRKVN
ncbi:MAG: hypothetical protein JWP88_315 [Flaviaesturariibacter sp.]|nr:hypothetical protein [Flaviaesturariibacter sp.]